jgi:hypothetical protein
MRFLNMKGVKAKIENNEIIPAPKVTVSIFLSSEVQKANHFTCFWQLAAHKYAAGYVMLFLCGFFNRSSVHLKVIHPNSQLILFHLAF